MGAEKPLTLGAMFHVTPLGTKTRPNLPAIHRFGGVVGNPRL